MQAYSKSPGVPQPEESVEHGSRPAPGGSSSEKRRTDGIETPLPGMRGLRFLIEVIQNIRENLNRDR